MSDLDREKAEEEWDNRLWKPDDALRNALIDIETGEKKPERLLILMVDHGVNGMEYNTHWYASNLRASEIISLCEVVKAQMVNFILNPEGD